MHNRYVYATTHRHIHSTHKHTFGIFIFSCYSLSLTFPLLASSSFPFLSPSLSPSVSFFPLSFIILPLSRDNWSCIQSDKHPAYQRMHYSIRGKQTVSNMYISFRADSPALFQRNKVCHSQQMERNIWLEWWREASHSGPEHLQCFSNVYSRDDNMLFCILLFI